jgi:hypothetical protein
MIKVLRYNQVNCNIIRIRKYDMINPSDYKDIDSKE